MPTTTTMMMMAAECSSWNYENGCIQRLSAFYLQCTSDDPRVGWLVGWLVGWSPTIHILCFAKSLLSRSMSILLELGFMDNRRYMVRWRSISEGIRK